MLTIPGANTNFYSEIKKVFGFDIKPSIKPVFIKQWLDNYLKEKDYLSSYIISGRDLKSRLNCKPFELVMLNKEKVLVYVKKGVNYYYFECEVQALQVLQAFIDEISGELKYKSRKEIYNQFYDYTTV